MDKNKLSRRHHIMPLIGGVVASSTCGALLYVWTVFINPLTSEFGWNKADIALAFAITLLFFGLVAFPAGLLNDRFGPRYVVMVGALLLGAGFISSGFIDYKWQLYISYGVIAGIGGGLIYLPPIATAPKWWPNHPALAIGVSVVGIGVGSLFMAPIATYIIANFSWRSVFIYAGIVLAIMAFFSSFCLKEPSSEIINGYSKEKAPLMPRRHYMLNETIKLPQFWLLWAACFFGSFAGIILLDNLTSINIDKSLLSWLAIANAISRVLMGGIADRFGTKLVLFYIFLLQVVILLLFISFGTIGWMFYLLSVFIGWNYGAMFTLFPALCVNYFGTQEHGSNYGLLFTSWGIAAFAGRFLGSLLDGGNFHMLPFIIGLLITGIALLLISIIKDVNE